VNTRGTVYIGYAIAALFILSFIVWGGSVPLTSAAIASGIVGVEGHKKQVQHLEGGIVSRINVNDGDLVEAGEVLLVLDDIEVRSEYNEINNRFIKASAEYARWSAEEVASTTITIPQWLLDNEDQAGIEAAIARQTDILSARSAVMQLTKKNLIHKINETAFEAESVSARLVKLKQKRELVSTELDEFARLRKKGIATRSQLFDLEKQVVNLDLEIGDSTSAVLLAEKKTAQLAAQITELESARIQESAEQAARSLKELDCQESTRTINHTGAHFRLCD